MKSVYGRWFFLLIMAHCCLQPPVRAAGAEFRASAAAVRITPPKGAPLAGYYYNRAAEGVHDDLYAKALVLQQETNKVAFVVCDLISLTRPIVEEARKIISETSGVKGDHVMMSATHTHTAPVLRGGSTRNAAQGGDEDIAARYTAELPKRIAESVRLAEQNLTNATPFAAWGRVDNLSFNRRYFMRDGTVGWNPGKLNTNIVRAAGPIDPDIAVFYVQTPDGKSLSTYVNFAMHPDTVGGLQISADYPYTLAKLLGDYKGPDMVTIFANSTCGNINHVDVNWRDPQKGHPEAARIGTILAGEVLQRYKKLRPVSIGPLRVRSEIVKLPLPLVKPEEIEEARRVAQIPAVTGTNQPKFLDRVKAYKILDVAAREGKPHEVEVQVIALGNDVAWVSLPGEIFVELGLAIKKASPFYYTFIAELANGSIGYIPNREAYAQGNYEVVSARCAEGSGELLLQSAINSLKLLRKDETSPPSR